MSTRVTFPSQIDSVTQLDDLLSRPTPAVVQVQAVRRLSGELLVLGAGGKMGPSLCKLARCDVEAAGYVSASSPARASRTRRASHEPGRLSAGSETVRNP